MTEIYSQIARNFASVSLGFILEGKILDYLLKGGILLIVSENVWKFIPFWTGTKGRVVIKI